jgi:YggT family protein
VLPILQLIVDTAASVLGGVLLLRFWMQVIRVRPLRRLVPGMGGYDWASLIGAFLVVLLASSVLLLYPGGDGQTVVLFALYRFCTWILYGFMGLLIIEVIFSWINPHAPLAPFVRALNEPLLRPLRRVIPPVGGLDLSVLAAFILLQIGLYVLRQLFMFR